MDTIDVNISTLRYGEHLPLQHGPYIANEGEVALVLNGAQKPFVMVMNPRQAFQLAGAIWMAGFRGSRMVRRAARKGIK